jgi:Ca2+-binding RTX toxin-like protein
MGGDDVINGLGGVDIIDAGDGANTVNGGGGDDEITVSGDPNDAIDGGTGDDWAVFLYASGPIDVDLSVGTVAGPSATGTISGIERVQGSFDGGTLTGDDGPNWLIAQGPDGKAYGNGGDDHLASYGDGDSVVDGGPGTDGCAGPNQVNCEGPLF